MKNIIEHEISQITKSILDDYGTGRNIDKMDLFNQPSKEEIIGYCGGSVKDPSIQDITEIAPY